MTEPWHAVMITVRGEVARELTKRAINKSTHHIDGCSCLMTWPDTIQSANWCDACLMAAAADIISRQNKA